MTAKWIVRVDDEICAGHALCEARAPEVYTVNDEGYSTADGTEVPAELEDKARRGMRACPERAIRLVPVDGAD